MYRSRNRRRRFRATIREETWTYGRHVLFDGPNSTASGRPHLKTWALKNPPHVNRDPYGIEASEWGYDHRVDARLNQLHLTEHMTEQYDDNTTWEKQTQDYYVDVPWAYAWIGEDLADWERELMRDNPHSQLVLVRRQTVWRQYDIPDDEPLPEWRTLMTYTTETPRPPAPPRRRPQPPTVEHLHPSRGGANIINAIGRSSNRGDVQRHTRTRVYDLAREIGMTPADLVTYLRDTGEYVRTSSSIVEGPVVRRVLTDLRPQEATA